MIKNCIFGWTISFFKKVQFKSQMRIKSHLYLLAFKTFSAQTIINYNNKSGKCPTLLCCGLGDVSRSACAWHLDVLIWFCWLGETGHTAGGAEGEFCNLTRLTERKIWPLYRMMAFRRTSEFLMLGREAASLSSPENCISGLCSFKILLKALKAVLLELTTGSENWPGVILETSSLWLSGTGSLRSLPTATSFSRSSTGQIRVTVCGTCFSDPCGNRATLIFLAVELDRDCRGMFLTHASLGM